MGARVSCPVTLAPALLQTKIEKMKLLQVTYVIRHDHETYEVRYNGVFRNWKVSRQDKPIFTVPDLLPSEPTFERAKNILDRAIKAQNHGN